MRLGLSACRPFKSRNCGRTLMTLSDCAFARNAQMNVMSIASLDQRTARTLGGRAEDDKETWGLGDKAKRARLSPSRQVSLSLCRFLRITETTFQIERT